MTLGQRIKAARKRLNPPLTQKQVAAEFGITEQAVSAWERGEGPPDLEKLAQLRRILKVTYVWLLEGDGPPPAANSAEVQADDIAPALQRQRSRVA